MKRLLLETDEWLRHRIRMCNMESVEESQDKSGMKIGDKHI